MTSLLEIMISFGKIGFTALGGGHSMLKLIEYEAVNHRHWVHQEDVISMIGSSFLFPGLTAVKLSALIGYKVSGILGLVLAVLSLNLPGLVMVTVGYQFLSKSDSPTAKKTLVAVQYGALAMLAAAAYSLAEGVLEKHFSPSLAILSGFFFMALVFGNLSPFWGLLAFIVLAMTLLFCGL